METGFSLLPLLKTGAHSTDPTDLEAIKAIADACKDELGFVRRSASEEALRQGRLVVVKSGEDWSVLGFVHFRCTRHGYVTIYETAVHPDWRGKGVGRALINAVTETAQRQKCSSSDLNALSI